MKGIKDTYIRLSVSTDILTVSDEGGSSTIQGMGAQDYPAIPAVIEGECITLSGLPDILGKISHAMATEDNRPVLYAASVNIDTEGGIMFATTDRWRLAVADEKYAGDVKAEHKIVVPFSTINVLSRVLTGDEVSVSFNDDRISFIQGDVVVMSQLIKGTFPGYQQLIPRDCPYQCTFSVQSMADALSRIKNIAREGSGIVRLVAVKGQDTMTVSCRAEDAGGIEVALPCTGEIKIAVQWSYLNDLIAVMKGTDKVTIETTDITSPIKVVNDTFTYVLMPMFVQW